MCQLIFYLLALCLVVAVGGAESPKVYVLNEYLSAGDQENSETRSGAQLNLRPIVSKQGYDFVDGRLRPLPLRNRAVDGATSARLHFWRVVYPVLPLRLQESLSATRFPLIESRFKSGKIEE
jgi:hypothetical protein